MPMGFRPGDRVPATGIYTASHDQHRQPHDVVVTQGENFPDCRTCHDRVSFSLAQAAKHIGPGDGFHNTAETEAIAKKQAKKSSGGGD